MSAYILVKADITDGDQYQEYLKVSPAVVARFDGKFIARGGEVVTLEGLPRGNAARVAPASRNFAASFLRTPLEARHHAPLHDDELSEHLQWSHPEAPLSVERPVDYQQFVGLAMPGRPDNLVEVPLIVPITTRCNRHNCLPSH